MKNAGILSVRLREQKERLWHDYHPTADCSAPLPSGTRLRWENEAYAGTPKYRITITLGISCLVNFQLQHFFLDRDTYALNLTIQLRNTICSSSM